MIQFDLLFISNQLLSISMNSSQTCLAGKVEHQSQFWAADRPSRSCRKSSGWFEKCTAICSFENKEDILIYIYIYMIIYMYGILIRIKVCEYVCVTVHTRQNLSVVVHIDKHMMCVCVPLTTNTSLTFHRRGLANTDDGSRFDGKPTSVGSRPRLQRRKKPTSLIMFWAVPKSIQNPSFCWSSYSTGWSMILILDQGWLSFFSTVWSMILILDQGHLQ